MKQPKRPEPSAENEIMMFWHCRQCLQELPQGLSPRDYARLEVGATPVGMQVWCKRHNINVCHIDFEGQTHPANLRRAKQKVASK